MFQESNPVFYQIGCKVKNVKDIPDLNVILEGAPIKINGHDLIAQCQIDGYGYACVLNIEFQ
jgi:hypothetical protein